MMSILQKVFSKRAICAALFVLFAVCCAVSFFLREVSAETIPAVESGPVYSVQNITKDATCEVDFINDYFGYSAPYDSSTYERSLVAYTYDAAEDGVITLKTANISFPGQDTYLLAEPAEGGNYTVTEIGRFSTDATPTADGYSITIPADGYALVTTNATSATPFSTNGQGNFVEGDTVSGIQDNSRWSFTDTTSGYSLKLTHEVTTSGMMDVDGSGALNGHYAVINRTAGTYVEMYSTRSYIVAQASGEGSYTISDVYATGTDTAAVNATRVNVPEGGFIVGLGYCYAGQRQYAKGGFITAAEVGDTIEFTDREAADPSTGITVTADNTPAEINAVNPEDVTVGQTALYCNVLNDYSGTGLLNTPERTDETVYEYVVMVIGDIEDGEHRIVEVRKTEGAIPAHGYVISAAKDLGWAVGDIATLSSTALPDGTKIAVFDMSLDFPDLGQRIMLTYKNHEITDGNRVVLSDTAVAGDVSSQRHAWSFDISCEYNEGRTGGTVTQITNRTDGTMGTTPIPEGGFVIYSHGSLNRTLIEQLRVGYSIIINDFNEQSDSFLTSVTIGETVIPFAGEGDFYTDYKVEDASQLETIIAGMQFASEYGKADIEVGAIESYTLPMEVTVTLTSPNGYFSNEYTIVFKVETSEDARLASVTVGDAALQSFAAETKNYTVDYAIGEALPTVAATAADAGATVSIQQATTENPQAVITVTAEDESFVWTYTIQFRVVDNTLSELWIGETKLTDFSPLQSEYTFSHSLRMIDGKVVWSIKNPANSAENLADKWCKDSKYATEFFRWVKQAQIDLVDILEGDNKFEDVRAKLKYCLDVDIENILRGFNFSEISQPRPFNMQRDIPKPYNVTYEL